MLVFDKGRGMPADLAAVPVVCGVESVAIDPRDPKVVYLAFRGERPSSIAKQYPSIPGAVYKSINGGLSFARSQLSIEMEPNGPWRGVGERLSIDPVNSRVLYYGSVKQGLHRSVDGGKTWTVVSSPDGPGREANVLALHFVPRDGRIQRDGVESCKSLYAVVAHGSVYHSVDGGETWTNIICGSSMAGTARISMGFGTAPMAVRALRNYPASTLPSRFASEHREASQATPPSPSISTVRMAGEKEWGIFRSCNSGKSWDRVSYFPGGIFDQPTCLATSWDEFGKLIIGNSYVFGTP